MTPSIWLQSVRCHATALILLLGVALGAWGALGGCGRFAPARPSMLVGPGPAEILADWDDLDAAVDVAAERSEMALVQANDPAVSPLVRRFELRTVAAEPVVLIVTRGEPISPEQGSSQVLTANVKVGRFGDAQREARFLGFLFERLQQLRGVEFRPI